MMTITQPTSLPFDNPPDTTSLNEIALDEALDALDPLRHLRTDSDASNFARDDEDTVAIIPLQPRSILGETIRLTFPVDFPRVSISLKVDASHGCGGIAWPAGEVGSYLLHARARHLMEFRSCQITSHFEASAIFKARILSKSGVGPDWSVL
jgi:hypothetical protein